MNDQAPMQENEPLECRFCHHDRLGQGACCHADLEKDWRTPAGQALVETWIQQHGLKTLFGGKR